MESLIRGRTNWSEIREKAKAKTSSLPRGGMTIVKTRLLTGIFRHKCLEMPAVASLCRFLFKVAKREKGTTAQSTFRCRAFGLLCWDAPKTQRECRKLLGYDLREGKCHANLQCASRPLRRKQTGNGRLPWRFVVLASTCQPDLRFAELFRESIDYLTSLLRNF